MWESVFFVPFLRREKMVGSGVKKSGKRSFEA